MKSKLPRARVVTRDQPILGAVRQMWTDATESVAECLRAVATAKIAELNPPESQPIRKRDFGEPERPRAVEVNWHHSFARVLNEYMRRDGIQRKILGVYRSEMAAADMIRVKHLPCGTTIEVSVPDVVYQFFRYDGLVIEVGNRVIDEPCPKCSQDVIVPDAIVRGED